MDPARAEQPSGKSPRHPWVLVVGAILATQFVFAAAAVVSRQIADSNSADLIQIARECGGPMQCGGKGGAGRLGLFSGASWERLVAFSLPRGGLGKLQLIQLMMLLASMGVAFAILHRYLGIRAAVLSLGVYLPLMLCVTEFRTLDAPNATPLPAMLFWAGMLLFLEFRAVTFALLASFALATCVTIYIVFILLAPFHLGIVALRARRPLTGTVAACIAFVIPVCLDSFGAVRAGATNSFRLSGVGLGVAVGLGLFVLVVRELRRIDLLGSMSRAARVGTVMTAALVYLTLTVWVASFLFRLPIPPESRYFVPAIFPLLFVASASVPVLGQRAFVVFALGEAVALALLCFAPNAPLVGRDPLIAVLAVLAVAMAGVVIIRRGLFSPPRLSFGMVLLLAFAIGVTLPDVVKPSGVEKHAFVLREGERIVSALYAKGYTYPELFGSLQGPAADTVLALAASLDPQLLEKPAFPVDSGFSLLLLKVPRIEASRTRDVIAEIPFDRGRSGIVIRQERPFVDWIGAEICRTTPGQSKGRRDCIRIVRDAPLQHLGEYVALSDSTSAPSDNRTRGAEHFARPSWRWPQSEGGAPATVDGQAPLYVSVPVRTPGRGIPHVVRCGGSMFDQTWRIVDVRDVEFEGELPGARIRLPDAHASSGVIDVEVRGVGDHPPWEWLRHFIEVTESNAHLLVQYERTTDVTGEPTRRS